MVKIWRFLNNSLSLKSFKIGFEIDYFPYCLKLPWIVGLKPINFFTPQNRIKEQMFIYYFYIYIVYKTRFNKQDL